MDDGGPVTIETFSDVEAARLAQSRLEASGIEAHLLDAHMIGLNWFYSLLIGGVKLVVAPEDAEDARQLLAEIPPEEPSPDEEMGEDRCRTCAARTGDLGRPGRGTVARVAAAVFLALALFVPGAQMAALVGMAIAVAIGFFWRERCPECGRSV